MNTWLSLLLLLVLVPSSVVHVNVSAYPTAAGSCPALQSAVGMPHVNGGRPETTGSLTDGGFQLLLNGDPVAAGKPSSFKVGEEQSIELKGFISSFKGFLIRFGPPPDGPPGLVDLREAIYPTSDDEDSSTNTQIADSTCVDQQQVGGLTHTNRNDKTSITGTLIVTTPVQGLSMDVTVVVANNAQNSTHYYSNFVIHAVEAVDPLAPVAAPPTTSFPTTMPSQAPSVGPNTTTTTTTESDNSDTGGDLEEEGGDLGTDMEEEETGTLDKEEEESEETGDGATVNEASEEGEGVSASASIDVLYVTSIAAVVVIGVLL